MILHKIVAGAMVVMVLLMSPALAKNTLKWASQGDALTFDPHSQNEGPTITALRQIYDPLVTRSPNMELEASLAESWELVGSDAWAFKLRQGVTFHDGTPFTAADVKFSFERAMSDTSDFKEQVASVKDIKIVDDHTIHFVTKGPNPIFPNEITSLSIMSQAWAQKRKVETPQDYKGGEENYAVRHANGTGPYKLQLREPDVRTVMVKNDNYWGTTGNIDEIIYTPVKNAATRVAALLSGELDFVLDPPFQDLKRIESGSGLQVKTVNQIRTIFLGMDQSVAELRTSSLKGKNPLADMRVRKAMYQAINIEAIRKKVMRGLSYPAGIITSPGVHGHTPVLDERHPYNVEAAKKLLAGAGYADGFDIRLDCPNNRYNNDEAICQAVVGMLGKIGIKVTLDAIPKSKHFPKISKRVTDFYMLGWGVPTLDSHYVFSYLFHSEGTWNGTGYSNAEMDKLIEALATEVDLAKRDELIQKVWDMARADVVYLPLHHQVIAWGMRDKLDIPIVPNDSPQFRWANFK
ncbi:MAG: ABC transporter substrate-binding protein [Candidatus Tectomicrobia bacterium]|nr:ABC transporter substrate-binding protein [Candidatus Tectomicrobia bacterium]